MKFAQGNDLKEGLGLMLMLLGVVGFLGIMHYFDFFGHPVQYTNLDYMAKELLAISCLIGGAYWGFYFYADKETAQTTAKKIIIAFVIAFIIGFLFNVILPTSH